MTIWSANNHIRHPWFDTRGEKRRHASGDYDAHSSSDESELPELHHLVKRPRWTVLEQGFAHLSLQHKQPQYDQPFVEAAQDMFPLAEECAMDADDEHDTTRHMLPGSIEEPEQEDIPEIQMKTSSWYELTPDRIVITDLDSFESEDDKVGENEGLSINTGGLLEHLKKQVLPIPRDHPSQALVLYRPLAPIPLTGNDHEAAVPMEIVES